MDIEKNLKIVGIVSQNNMETLLANPEIFISQSGLLDCRLIEFRADTFSVQDLERNYRDFMSALKTNAGLFDPVPEIILTIRKKEDGGVWIKSDLERQKVFEDLMDIRVPDYIDLEIETLTAKTGGAYMGYKDKTVSGKDVRIKLIISHHSFIKSYTQLEFKQMAGEMLRYRPDVLKFAVTALSDEDVEELFKFVYENTNNGCDMCVISMGKYGKITRIGSPLLGAFWTYGFIGNKELVPGQIHVSELKQLILKANLSDYSLKHLPENHLSAYPAEIDAGLSISMWRESLKSIL